MGSWWCTWKSGNLRLPYRILALSRMQILECGYILSNVWNWKTVRAAKFWDTIFGVSQRTNFSEFDETNSQHAKRHLALPGAKILYACLFNRCFRSTRLSSAIFESEWALCDISGNKCRESLEMLSRWCDYLGRMNWQATRKVYTRLLSIALIFLDTDFFGPTLFLLKKNIVSITSNWKGANQAFSV